MSNAITIQDYLKSLSSASSLDSRSIIVTDSAGNPEKVSKLFIMNSLMNIQTSYVTDLNEATSPGLYLLDGQHNAQNGPEGMDLYVGILEVFGRYGTGTLFQRISNRKGQLATRAHYNAQWSPWHILQ